MLKKLFVEALPSLAKATASVVKDHKGKVSSKRVFSVFGGGTLITVGLNVIDSGLASSDDKVLMVGLGLVGLGVVAGYLASFNIKEISAGAEDKKAE